MHRWDSRVKPTEKKVTDPRVALDESRVRKEREENARPSEETVRSVGGSAGISCQNPSVKISRPASGNKVAVAPTKLFTFLEKDTMKQVTFAIACVILWSLQAARCEAQDEPSETESPPEIEELSESQPDPSIPPEATDPEATEPEATEPEVVAESDPEPSDAVARASEAVLQRIARLQAEKTGPTIDDICEVKHYGHGKLHGFGLVLDLQAIVASQTGQEDEDEGNAEGNASVDLEKLVETLNLLNQSQPKEDPEKEAPETSIVARLDGIDNLTVVSVSAEAPPEGLREGERIDCKVESMEGTSLENGHLLPTRLSTWGPGKEPNAAIAAGPLSDTGRSSEPKTVVGGCLVETDICDQFTQDNNITLVLDEDHARFSVAQAVVDLINLEMQAGEAPVAKALNRYSIEVSVPAEYQEDPVAFVTRILKLPAPEAMAEDLRD